MVDVRWDELVHTAGDGPSVTRLRVAPESSHDLFIGIIQPRARYCFWYDVPTAVVPHDYRLPPLRSVSTTVKPLADIPETTRIELVLANTELGDVYKAMVNDLLRTIAAAPDDDSGLAALSQRAERWRRLLETDGAGGLSTTDRRGLVGELIVLGQLLDSGGAVSTVTAWTGPYRKHQDFQASQAAIEVKTTVVKQPQSLIIASERELDPTGVPHLYLVHVSVDERQGGSGQSLNALITELRARLSTEMLALAAFDEALLSYGYLSEQASLYEAPKYSVREENAFEVNHGFPCIIESDLPLGVGDVTYRIQLAALWPYEVSLTEVLTTTVAR
jgi:hypothetical protein